MAYLRGRTVKNSLLKNLSSITIAVFKSLVGIRLIVRHFRFGPMPLKKGLVIFGKQ